MWSVSSSGLRSGAWCWFRDALSVRAKVPYFQDKTLAQDEQYQSRATFVPLPLPPGKAVVQP